MPKQSSPALAISLSGFDALPDSALMREPELKALLGVSHSTIWRLVNRGELPIVKITQRCTGWRVGDVRAYLARRSEAS